MGVDAPVEGGARREGTPHRPVPVGYAHGEVNAIASLLTVHAAIDGVWAIASD